MAVLVSDSFNRANGNTLGSTDSYNGGTAKTWAMYGSGKSGGVYGISGNTAYCVTQPSNNDEAYIGVNTGSSDYTVSAVITGSPNYSGFAIRGTGDNNFLFVQFVPGNIQTYLKSGDGTYSRLSSIAYTYTVGDTISVACQGSAISIYKNVNTLLGTLTTSYNQAGTYVGLVDQNGIFFDNFNASNFNTGTAYTGAGTVQGTSNLTSSEHMVLKAVGTIQGNPLVSSLEKFILKAFGTVQGVSILTSGETLIIQIGTTFNAGGTIQSQSVLTSNEHYWYKAIGTIQSVPILTSVDHEFYTANGIIQANSVVSSRETVAVAQTIIGQIHLDGLRKLNVYVIGYQDLNLNLDATSVLHVNLYGEVSDDS